MRDSRQLREMSVTGLEALLRCPVTVVPLLTSLPACLPACLVLRSCRVMLHADEHRVIQQENEKAGVGVTKGRVRHCAFSQLGGKEGKRGKRK